MNQSFDSNPAQPPTSNVQASQVSGQIAQLTQQTQNGAKNFYWIAGLSFVNSLITAFGGEFYLVMGLATTLFVDYFAVGMGQEIPDMAMILKVIALAVSLVISGIFALFGFLAAGGKRWAYLVGMVFYGVDTLIMLVLQDWIGFAFHLFFLWALFTGLRALNQLQKLKPARQMDFPQNIG
jgi:hypothetical protein